MLRMSLPDAGIADFVEVAVIPDAGVWGEIVHDGAAIQLNEITKAP